MQLFRANYKGKRVPLSNDPSQIPASVQFSVEAPADEIRAIAGRLQDACGELFLFERPVVELAE